MSELFQNPDGFLAGGLLLCFCWPTMRVAIMSTFKCFAILLASFKTSAVTLVASFRWSLSKSVIVYRCWLALTTSSVFNWSIFAIEFNISKYFAINAMTQQIKIWPLLHAFSMHFFLLLHFFLQLMSLML